MSLSQSTSTHCPYCALQCGMHAIVREHGIEIAGNTKFPVNEGGLCVKGWTAAGTLRHPDRLLTPLARNANDTLVPVGWDVALDRIAVVVSARPGVSRT